MPRSRDALQQHVTDFGDRVRVLREAAGLSQEALAHAAGFHRAEIGFIERSEREIGISRVVPLARALGVTPGDLFSRDGEQGVG